MLLITNPANNGSKRNPDCPFSWSSRNRARVIFDVESLHNRSEKENFDLIFSKLKSVFKVMINTPDICTGWRFIVILRLLITVDIPSDRFVRSRWHRPIIPIPYRIGISYSILDTVSYDFEWHSYYCFWVCCIVPRWDWLCYFYIRALCRFEGPRWFRDNYWLLW